MKIKNKDYWCYMWEKKGDLLFQFVVYAIVLISFVVTLYPAF